MVRLLSAQLIFVVAFILTGCRKPSPDNTSCPCEDASRTSADFVTYEEIGLLAWTKPRIYYSDTFNLYSDLYDSTKYEYATVHFSAKDQTAQSYKWILDNTNQISTSKSFFTYFDQPYGAIGVKLIIKRKPNKFCFPDDDGIDSVKKTIYLKKYTPPLLHGEYLGYNSDNPQDTFRVNIKYGISYTGNYSRILTGLPRESKATLPTDLYTANKGTYAFYSKGYSGCVSCDFSTIRGWGELIDKKNSLRIEYDYMYKDSNGDMQTTGKKTFIGTRVK